MFNLRVNLKHKILIKVVPRAKSKFLSSYVYEIHYKEDKLLSFWKSLDEIIPLPKKTFGKVWFDYNVKQWKDKTKAIKYARKLKNNPKLINMYWDKQAEKEESLKSVLRYQSKEELL